MNNMRHVIHLSAILMMATFVSAQSPKNEIQNSVVKTTDRATAATSTGSEVAKVAWSDTSGHQVRFVTVEPGVQLEVLDWGGKGEALVLLTGLGNTAHVYDHFAHNFTDCFRVIGITRRGFGQSSKPAQGYDVETRTRDDVKILDALGIKSAFFAGHSIAGDELSKLGAVYSDRVKKLVYLDAVDYGAWGAVFKAYPPPNPPPFTTADKESVERFAAAYTRIFGIRMPEAEIRQTSQFDAVGCYIEDDSQDNVAQKITDLSQPAAYGLIGAPALAIYNHFTRESAPWDCWGLDRPQQEQADYFWEHLLVWLKDARQRFRSEVKNSRVVELEKSHHYVFIRDEADVVREMRKFLLKENANRKENNAQLPP